MKNPKLLKTASLIAYIINAILGYCVWLIPGFLLQYSSSISISYIALTICSLIAFIFSICYAELGSIFFSGYGEPTYYEYFYGKYASKIYSCVSIFIILPLCMIINVSYSIDPIPGNKKLNKFILLIVLLLLNIIRLDLSLRIQEILTYIKIFIFSIIPILALSLKFGIFKSKESLILNVFNNKNLLKDDFIKKYGNNSFKEIIFKLMLLLPLIINAYDGLNSANYITNRIYNPIKTFKRALPIAILIISFIYFLIISSFFYVIPLKNILSLSNDKNITILTLFCDQFIFFKYSNIFLQIISTIGNLASLNGLFIVMVFITQSLLRKYYKYLTSLIILIIYFIGFINCEFNKYLSYTTLSIYICYFLTMILLSYLCFKKEKVYLNNEVGKELYGTPKLNVIWPLLAGLISLILIIFSIYNLF